MGSTSGTLEQLRHHLDQMSALLERLALPRLDLVRLLIHMAQQQLRIQSLPTDELKRMPAELLRSSLREQGAMATAQFIESLRASAWTDVAIIGLLGWKDARRLRHYTILLKLSPPVQAVLCRYGLSERQVRPVLPFQRSPNFLSLVEWIGSHGLSARQVSAWARCRGSSDSLHPQEYVLGKNGTSGVGLGSAGFRGKQPTDREASESTSPRPRERPDGR